MKKKLLFLQIKGNSLGGVWFVNKALGEYFLKQNYDVEVIGIRNNKDETKIKDTNLKIKTINTDDVWEIIHRRDVLLKCFKKGFLKTFFTFLKDHYKLKKDFKKTKTLIKQINPDYIIASQYQLLHCIPKKYLNRTISVQHVAFDTFSKDRVGLNTVKKFSKKIAKNCWLCETSMEKAKEKGIVNNTFIYNPNKFSTDKIADVVNNKKIAVISRIHEEKRIDLMLEIINDVFEAISPTTWTFEIYGTGSFNEKSLNILKTNPQISYKGITNDPKSILLKSSLTLNTSLFEGFPLSIIEGYTCGLPVVSFNYGESAKDAIIDGKTGFIVKQNDINEYKKKLIQLLTDDELLLKFSNNAKQFSQMFSIEKISKQWEKLFNEIEVKNERIKK